MVELTEQRARDRRQAILDATTALFARRGFSDTSMADIVAAWWSRSGPGTFGAVGMPEVALRGRPQSPVPMTGAQVADAVESLGGLLRVLAPRSRGRRV